MRRGLTLGLVLSCFGALFLICYAPAIFMDQQFGYRDAGHYYYPLNQRVQAEWNQGRWPLWEPEENAGMPLLGNPTAAVLYPGKLVFAILPYAWGAKVYIVAHSALAFLTHARLDALLGHERVWLGIARIILCVWRSHLISIHQYHLPDRGGLAPPGLARRRSAGFARAGGGDYWSWQSSCRCRCWEATPRPLISWDWPSIGYAVGLTWSRATIDK